ncbi:uncharacterized protein JN550_002854 [Neoarthrinium moseri]|uniref:uncharacterized protein n=1 Tax=Neoarthrinium moseri TaxID=1658444 RepID=UPI001FDE0062|nr:uncharacterized protein JN550_002854 [Neoarthrinium moseri]KAI1874275.1 hypothetical protein JN550_002854 [Neoarthrinium moseri]
MPLCQLCSSLDFAALSQPPSKDSLRLTWTVGGGLRFSYDHPGLEIDLTERCLTHHYDSFSLLEASARKCDLCSLMLGVVDRYRMEYNRLGMLRGYNPVLPEFKLWLRGRDNGDGFEILAEAQTNDRRWKFSLPLLGGIGIALRETEFVKGRLIDLSPKTPRTVNMVRNWIAECSEQHQHTASLSEGMPSMVLKILDSGNKVCLDVPTVAVVRLKEGIRTSTLPKTFQDAVWLAYQLDIEYIWIDSLCIIQDDIEDWNRESARMDRVYQNSWLNIAADRAADSYEGFLGERHIPEYVAIPFCAQGTTLEALAYTLPWSCIGDRSRLSWIEDEPLTTRAWALQERYLAQRTVHFTRHRILLECPQHCIAEDFDHSLTFSTMTQVLSKSYAGEQSVTDSRHLDWLELVENYTTRKLTLADDKLPALSGLAAHFARNSHLDRGYSTTPFQYLAGHWSDHIVRSLCWECREGGGKRPTKYRAPTWSWASLDAQIKCTEIWIDHAHELVSIKHVHVDLESSQSPYGKVTGGYALMGVSKTWPLSVQENDWDLQFGEEDIRFRLSIFWDLEEYGRYPREDEIRLYQEEGLVAVPLGWTGVPKLRIHRY